MRTGLGLNLLCGARVVLLEPGAQLDCDMVDVDFGERDGEAVEVVEIEDVVDEVFEFFVLACEGETGEELEDACFEVYLWFVTFLFVRD